MSRAVAPPLAGGPFIELRFARAILFHSRGLLTLAFSVLKIVYISLGALLIGELEDSLAGTVVAVASIRTDSPQHTLEAVTRPSPRSAVELSS